MLKKQKTISCIIIYAAILINIMFKRERFQTENKKGEKMNVYDTANQLAQEIKQSEEYATYKIAKETISLNFELKK